MFPFPLLHHSQSVMVVEKGLWEKQISLRCPGWGLEVTDETAGYFLWAYTMLDYLKWRHLRKADVWEDESSEILDSQRGREFCLLSTLFYVEETAHSVSLGGKNNPASYWGNSIRCFLWPFVAGIFLHVIWADKNEIPLLGILDLEIIGNSSEVLTSAAIVTGLHRWQSGGGWATSVV